MDVVILCGGKGTRLSEKLFLDQNPWLRLEKTYIMAY